MMTIDSVWFFSHMLVCALQTCIGYDVGHGYNGRWLSRGKEKKMALFTMERAYIKQGHTNQKTVCRQNCAGTVADFVSWAAGTAKPKK